MNHGKLTDEEIIRHKDFDALMNSYRLVQRPVYKKPWFVAGASIAGVAAIFLILFFTVFNQRQLPTKDNPVDPLNVLANRELLPKKVSPPLADFNVEVQEFKVSCDRPVKLSTKTGTRIEIPAGAFTDKNGKDIKGEIDIRFRELNNPLDFFLAGIPMHLEKDGNLRQLESSGMFEILAFQDEQALELAENVSIEVDLNTSLSGGDEVFFFDAQAETWAQVGNCKLQPLSEAPPVKSQKTKTEIDTSSLPAFPQLASPGKRIIPPPADQDLSGVPGLEGYQHVFFNINESYCQVDDRLFEKTWQRTELKPAEVKGNYFLTMTNRDTSFTFMVYPVFKQKDYKVALAYYNQQKSILIAENESKQAKITEPESNRQLTDELVYREMKPNGHRAFKLNKLGLFSSGKTFEFVTAPSLVINLTDTKGNLIKGATLYIVDRTKNTLYNFGVSEKIFYRENTTNLFWALTKDGKIGLLSEPDFANLQNDQGKADLKLNLIDFASGVDALRTSLKI